MLDLDAIEKQCRADWGLHASDALPVIAECRQLRADVAHLNAQIERIASYILANVPGEPSQSEGACDTAIRILAERQAQLQHAQSWIAGTLLTPGYSGWMPPVGYPWIDRDEVEKRDE